MCREQGFDSLAQVLIATARTIQIRLARRRVLKVESSFEYAAFLHDVTSPFRDKFTGHSKWKVRTNHYLECGKTHVPNAKNLQFFLKMFYALSFSICLINQARAKDQRRAAVRSEIPMIWADSAIVCPPKTCNFTS